MRHSDLLESYTRSKKWGTEYGSQYNSYYSELSSMLATPHNCLKILVGAWRLELQTSCAQGLFARRISKLHRVLWNATECDNLHNCKGLIEKDRQWVALGRVRWWAQNWAQSCRRRIGSELSADRANTNEDVPMPCRDYFYFFYFSAVQRSGSTDDRGCLVSPKCSIATQVRESPSVGRRFFTSLRFQSTGRQFFPFSLH